MNKKYIKVMADYCANGLWDYDGTMLDNLTLNLSNGIIDRLEKWLLWYNKENQDYLDYSKRTTNFDRTAFSIEGLKIAQDIKNYLGKEWTVVYFDEKQYYDSVINPPVYVYEIK